MVLNFDFRKTTLSVISEISSAFQNTFCFFQEHPRPRNSIFSDMQVLGSLSFFLEISIFWFRVWPLCQNDRAEHFFQVWKKNQTFSHFFMLWRGKNQSDFFHKAKQNPTGPPLKNDDEPKFSLFEKPLFFCLRNNFTKSVITQSINIRDLLTFEPFDQF